jgi:hypothetical protein
MQSEVEDAIAFVESMDKHLSELQKVEKKKTLSLLLID